MERISAIEALRRLKAGSAVTNAEILEPIELRTLCPPLKSCQGDSVAERIEFHACRLNSLDAPMVYFLERLTLTSTRVEAAKGSFYCCYFFKGAEIERCEFVGPVEFK